MQNGALGMTTILSEDLRRFVADAQWTFAKTMPTWPHEYLVRGRVDPVLFEALVAHIRARGYEGRCYRRAITHFVSRESDLVPCTSVREQGRARNKIRRCSRCTISSKCRALNSA